MYRRKHSRFIITEGFKYFVILFVQPKAIKFSSEFRRLVQKIHKNSEYIGPIQPTKKLYSSCDGVCFIRQLSRQNVIYDSEHS